jgi:hypothetical protein
MGDVVRVGSLEIDQDLRYQRLEWRLERLAWLVIGLVLLAAAAGLFGSGPLSSSEVASGPVRVEYQRFLREGSGNRLAIAAQTGAADVLVIQVSRAYLSRMRVEQISPEPRRIAMSGEWARLEFDVEPHSRAEIAVDLEPNGWGRVEGAIAVAGDGSVSFRQLIYP